MWVRDWVVEGVGLEVRGEGKGETQKTCFSVGGSDIWRMSLKYICYFMHIRQRAHVLRKMEISKASKSVGCGAHAHVSHVGTATKQN